PYTTLFRSTVSRLPAWLAVREEEGPRRGPSEVPLDRQEAFHLPEASQWRPPEEEVSWITEIRYLRMRRSPRHCDGGFFAWGLSDGELSDFENVIEGSVRPEELSSLCYGQQSFGGRLCWLERLWRGRRDCRAEHRFPRGHGRLGGIFSSRGVELEDVRPLAGEAEPGDLAAGVDRLGRVDQALPPQSVDKRWGSSGLDAEELSDLSGVRSHPAVFVSHLLNVGEEFPDLLHVAVLSVRFGLVVATLLAERLRVNSLCHSQQPSELLGRHGHPLLAGRGYAVTLVHDHRERVVPAPLLQVVRRLGLSLTHRRGEVDRGGVLRLQSDRHTVDAGDPVSDPGNVAEVLRPV